MVQFSTTNSEENLHTAKQTGKSPNKNIKVQFKQQNVINEDAEDDDDGADSAQKKRGQASL